MEQEYCYTLYGCISRNVEKYRKEEEDLKKAFLAESESFRKAFAKYNRDIVCVIRDFLKFFGLDDEVSVIYWGKPKAGYLSVNFTTAANPSIYVEFTHKSPRRQTGVMCIFADGSEEYRRVINFDLEGPKTAFEMLLCTFKYHGILEDKTEIEPFVEQYKAVVAKHDIWKKCEIKNKAERRYLEAQRKLQETISSAENAKRRWGKAEMISFMEENELNKIVSLSVPDKGEYIGSFYYQRNWLGNGQLLFVSLNAAKNGFPYREVFELPRELGSGQQTKELKMELLHRCKPYSGSIKSVIFSAAEATATKAEKEAFQEFYPVPDTFDLESIQNLTRNQKVLWSAMFTVTYYKSYSFSGCLGNFDQKYPINSSDNTICFMMDAEQWETCKEDFLRAESISISNVKLASRDKVPKMTPGLRRMFNAWMMDTYFPDFDYEYDEKRFCFPYKEIPDEENYNEDFRKVTPAEKKLVEQVLFAESEIETLSSAAERYDLTGKVTHIGCKVTKPMQSYLTQSGYLPKFSYSDKHTRPEHINIIKQNYQLSMLYFQHLDPDEFNSEINAYLKRHPEFIQVTDLNLYRDTLGIYMMVLDDYRQVYIGSTASNFRQRIQSHWSRIKEPGKLVVGEVSRSIMDIDSFKHLDTTRIYVYPISAEGKILLKNLEYLYMKDFPAKFRCNRTNGESIVAAEDSGVSLRHDLLNWCK